MPEMDDIELAQHVAAVAPEMRVLFVTGFAAVTLKAGEAVPQAKVLSKPFHLRDLVLEVDRLFRPNSAPGLSSLLFRLRKLQLARRTNPSYCLPSTVGVSIIEAACRARVWR